MKKYNTEDLFREIRKDKRRRFYADFIRSLWAFYPCGCLLAMILTACAIGIAFAYVLYMWFTSPSLFGTY